MNKILTFIIFLSYQISSAQTDSLKTGRNNFLIKIGYDNTMFKDLSFSPLNYSANSAVYKFGYQRDFKKNNELSVNIDFSNGKLKHKTITDFDSKRYLINFKIAYLQNLTLRKNKIKIKAGLQYHTYFNFVDYNELDAFSYFGLHSSDMVIKLYYQLNNKHSISSTFEMPFFGLLVRPPYSSNNKFQSESSNLKIATSGKWTSLNNFFSVTWSTDYNFKLSSRFNLLASYGFTYNTTNYLQRTIIVDNQILLGIKYKY